VWLVLALLAPLQEADFGEILRRFEADEPAVRERASKDLDAFVRKLGSGAAEFLRRKLSETQGEARGRLQDQLTLIERIEKARGILRPLEALDVPDLRARKLVLYNPGTIYTVNAAGPLPCRVVNPTRLTSAVGAMGTAYNDAAGRTLPNAVNLGAGQIGGLTLAPGLYKWTSNVSISTDVTLRGGPNDVFILQIAGTLTQAAAKKVILTGGAQAKNVFWQTGGAAAIGTTAHFEGTILSKTLIAMKTGASINGRLLAQTAVTLQKNVVTKPV